ncbi:MAG: hypothetical protein HYV63_14485 [Candidatus Schekmanbacteria bacterium]|nr:hypothetical protein [Candidatus Schekmanbacteria bacterium]
MLHQALVALFENRPDLAVELLRGVAEIHLPPFDRSRIDAASSRQARPVELRSDAVIVLERAEKAVWGVIVEIQLERDGDKRFSWPAYVCELRARHRCPATLLVLAPSEAVASWAAVPIDLGQPRSPFVPLVFGPTSVPWVRNLPAARSMPELAVLSAIAHGNEPEGIAVVSAAIEAASELEGERAVLYYDLMMAALGEAMRRRIEEMLRLKDYEYQTEMGRELGELYSRGRAEGKAEGKAELILRVLAARGVQVSADQRRIIASCRDPEVLDRWFDKALAVTDACQLFQDGGVAAG